jgi:histidinol dehydrogenase
VACEITVLCVRLPFQLLDKVTNFHEIWYGSYASESNPKLIDFANFLQSVITTQRMHEICYGLFYDAFSVSRLYNDARNYEVGTALVTLFKVLLCWMVVWSILKNKYVFM